MRTARFVLWLAWINLAFLTLEAILNAIGSMIHL
jgi:hypothetical protein